MWAALVDVDEWPMLATRLDVSAVPTLLVFRRGEIVARLVQPYYPHDVYQIFEQFSA
jgi:thioredoxin-like negative regulator of GroEL